jgi:hypothetical protein
VLPNVVLRRRPHSRPMNSDTHGPSAQVGG